MQDPSLFYKNQIEKHQHSLDLIKKQLFASSMVRLAVFCAAVFCIYLFFGQPKWVIGTVLVALAVFLFMVARHTELQYNRDKVRALININTTEIEVLHRNFQKLPEGNEFKDPLHHFSQDIDLFGRGSFYQYCNRTVLRQGSETLAELLRENVISDIHKKQVAVKELSVMPEWRQEFSAIASLVKAEMSYRSIIGWMHGYARFVPGAMKYVPSIFTLFSTALFAASFLGWISGWVVVGWFFLGLGITSRFLKKMNALCSDISKIQDTFRQYQKLIVELERIDFESDLLKEKKEAIVRDAEKTSTILSQFLKLLNALDQRNNIFMGPLINGFLLWDLHQAFKIEKWINDYGHRTEAWFKAIAFFDAYNSLGNFAYNHPDYIYPVLTNVKVVWSCEGAAHPLLDPKKMVRNDFQINEEQFFIITGANMAGKSTFLRTVSLQIVMANIGLPVCATKATYSPIKLITSMRTTDSLTDDESYFFSELKRLRFIVDEIGEDRYFIVLDEILKGTNSTDKAKGSRQFVERLAGSKSTGIIATHDLSLCQVATEFPQVKNYYFDAEIIDDELHFDYKFKKGVCQNMNASFLLNKMGIVN